MNNKEKGLTQKFLHPKNLLDGFASVQEVTTTTSSPHRHCLLKFVSPVFDDMLSIDMVEVLSALH